MLPRFIRRAVAAAALALMLLAGGAAMSQDSVNPDSVTDSGQEVAGGRGWATWS